jgi:hypothetical protein
MEVTGELHAAVTFASKKELKENSNSRHLGI